jgi:hypothetical protein
MNRFIFLVLVIPALACGQFVTPTVTPTVSLPPPSPSATLPAPTQTAEATGTDAVNVVTIRAVVYIRAEADKNSADLGALETGRTVELISCADQWCNVVAEIDGEQVSGWVYRGCTSDNPDGLLCEVR